VDTPGAGGGAAPSLRVLRHEARTPLAALAAAVEVLDPAEPTTAPIRAAVAHLSDLLAAPDSGGAAASVPLARSCWQVAQLLQPLLDDRQLQLAVQVDGSLAVVADELAVRQVLLNLLTNAARYAPPGSQVTVTAQRRGAQVAVQVADQGPGVPPPLEAVVFVEGVTTGEADPVSPDRRSGIGLPVARQLARRYGGELLLLPSVSGARFELRLPAG